MAKRGRQGEGGGSEPLFTDAKKLQNKINEYYNWCEENEKPICVTGLAWYLGTNRMTLLNYKNDNMVVKFKEENPEEYKAICSVIRKAYARVEFEYETYLFDRSKTTGSIFTLKNNFSWKDQQEIVTTNKETDISEEDINKQLEELGVNVEDNNTK